MASTDGTEWMEGLPDTDGHELEQLDEFYRRYYRDEIGELARKYPQERRTLWVEAADLYKYDQELYRKFTERPGEYADVFAEALRQYDKPVDVSFDHVKVRLTDTREFMDRKGVGDLYSDDLGTLVAVRCQLGRVAERKARLKVARFDCMRCPDVRFDVPQEFSTTTEPHSCPDCGRQGPFDLLEDDSEWVDERKIKMEAPPESRSGAEIVGYCIDELADPDDVYLQEKPGSRVTVIGKLEADKSSLFSGRDGEPVADEYFVPHSFVWGENVRADIDVDEYRDDVERFAGRGDAIDVFARNIDPSLVITPPWRDAIEMATAWLFAAPRISPDGGDTFRGDIHMLFVSDPGMNKSAFAEKLASLSPKPVLKGSEGMSSGVGLTAAASRDGFADDTWNIKPGALPKANDGHLILDEIDKGPQGFLDGIHAPLEGEQVLRVEKAGQEANLATRCGFLALGNPTKGRFDPYESIAEQIDLHPALMSRFDLICTMTDDPDESQDSEIADGVLDAVDESARIQHGDLDAEDAGTVSGEVPRAVMQAWVKLARQEIQPLLTDDAKQVLKEFYVETRQLNGEDSEQPPTTTRTLPAGIRIAMAFARCELSETVEERHAERAVELSKRIIGGHNFDPETGVFDANRTTEAPSTQEQRRSRIEEAIRSDAKTPVEIADEINADVEAVRHDLEKWHAESNPARVLKDADGAYRWVA